MSKAEAMKVTRSKNPKVSDVQNCTPEKTDAERASEAGISTRTLKNARKTRRDDPEM